MDLKNILNEIEQAGKEGYEKTTGRRDVIKGFGAKVAVAALPLAVSSLFRKASGKTTATNVVVNALNFILQLEYFQYNFYHTANNTGTGTIPLIPLADQAGFQTIEGQQKEHIAFLNSTITALGGVPYTPPNYVATALNPLFIVSGTYDFTAGGTYQTFSDYPTFLIIAQIFEDTAVHAYKGQIPTFLSNATLLGQMMAMQCVEGRHAAHVRLVRRFIGALENPAPWITNNIPPTVPLQPFYVTENNTIQAGIDITTLTDIYTIDRTIPTISATAAFDEAMDQPTVMSLLKPFMLS